MANVVDITNLLLAAAKGDAAARDAETQLHSFHQSNYPSYAASLAAELSNNQKPPDSRRLAGLLLKNSLDARDDARKLELQAKWGQLDAGLRTTIKTALLSTLHSDAADVRHTAAMVVAKVAAIELPHKQWPDLVTSLINNMGAQPSAAGLKQATLEALGYICEEMAMLKEEVLTPAEVNMILTAVVAGMRPDEPSMEIRLAATTALSNAVEFAEHNFENEQERNYIMQMVCQGTVAAHPKIRVESFFCLHEIAAGYYRHLPAYMQEIFNITVNAIKNQQEDEEVRLQAVEFWSTVCDIEIELTEDEDDTMPNHKFIEAVSSHLVPVLLEQLTKQESDEPDSDETSWNMAMAAGTCLGLMARAAKDAIVPLVLPFVHANITRATSPEDWHFREAATFAFGSILDGPSPTALQQVVQQGLVYLLQALGQDPSDYVRDTTAWTIGRIFEFASDMEGEGEIINSQNLVTIIQALGTALADPKQKIYVRERICNAIGRLADSFQGHPGNTSPLSPFFRDIVQVLFTTATPADPSVAQSLDMAKLQIAAFEAINDMVRASSHDTLDIVAQLIPSFLSEISKTFAMNIQSSEAREKQGELQGQLCGVLTVIIHRLGDSQDTKAAVLQHADAIMAVLLQIFSLNAASVHEEAMMAVGAFTYACGKQFMKYMDSFYPHLLKGLRTHQEWQNCLAAVGVLTDLCRTIEDGIANYCDEIMAVLVQNLGGADVSRRLKPQILAAFGDIALALEDKFDKYLATIRGMLQQAMHLSMQQAAPASKDEDLLEYNNELRVGIMDALTGMFNGLGQVLLSQLKQDVPNILAFINSIADDAPYEPQTAKGAINLLGDILNQVPESEAVLKSSPMNWQELLSYCRNDHMLSDDIKHAWYRISSLGLSSATGTSR